MTSCMAVARYKLPTLEKETAGCSETSVKNGIMTSHPRRQNASY